ncbi:MAG: type II toxin-antitoxin system HicB family antitoxin [Bacteroidales bacterium]|jgi:predicted HicB family RNase H-like nuclease|nr:type II toxin-antitoxin system HicB family antitoxin [Bacteroidales bacterium]
MNDVLAYKGFIGSVHFSADDNVFFGKVEGINDLVTFEGYTVQELKNAFHYMVDEHIKDCEQENKPVEKSYKGSFNIRISPNLHKRVALFAKSRGISINSYIKNTLEKNFDLV